MNNEEIQAQLKRLDAGWKLADDSQSIARRFEFKGFAKAVYLSNLCVWLADEHGHHPDIAFGWGYCEVRLTSHDIGSLSERDFKWAARLDELTA